MYLIGGQFVVSPSDLTGFLACEHLTQQELAVTRGELVRPERTDPELEVVTRRGLEHEQRYLEKLRAADFSIAAINVDGSTLDSLRAAEAQTLEALRAGVDAVYQATFFDGRWRCHADFLLKVRKPSAIGDYSYEVADTKLATRAKTGAVLQLCAYSEQLARLQGVEPDAIHVVLGTMAEERFRLKDYAAYYRSVKQRFEEAAFGGPVTTYPDPVEHCSVCRWNQVCLQRRRDDDHLSLVAYMTRGQTRKFMAAGIRTVAALAALPATHTVKAIGGDTLTRLRDQARLQILQRETGRSTFELLPAVKPGLGLGLLPPPSPGDLFFDMEGDPFAADGGLEYLFGITEIVAGAPVHHAFWAHDRAQERRAFEQLIDLVISRLSREPNLHVFHYAAYEPSALKRLMGTYASREAEVDRLLRSGVLVDLYKVVRQSIRASTESYSLKELEPLYRAKRTATITNASDSIVAYEQWLETGADAILGEIERYNREDCESTWQLRDWLEAQRVDAIAQFGDVPRPEPRQGDPTEHLKAWERKVADIAGPLLATVPEDPGVRTPEQRARYVLAHSLAWHRREAKSQWWEYYARCEMTPGELYENSGAIAGLQYLGAHGRVKRSIVHRYAFDPAQEFKIGVGDQPHDPRRQAPAGLVHRIDTDKGIIELLRGAKSAVPHPADLIPESPFDTNPLGDALLRLGHWVLINSIRSEGPYAAGLDLLCLIPPRVRGQVPGSGLVLPTDRSASDAARRCALGLEHSYLPIQGPPGSGKTRTGADMILDLVSAGMRVGVTANSHKVIGNLLDKVSDRALERGMRPRIIQKAEGAERCKSPRVLFATSNNEVEHALDSGVVDVIAGTAWLFASEALLGKLDFLVVDEAGQMSLANVLAICGSARNFVLLGDPNQLRQPSHGVHPPAVDVSALDHVLGRSATLSAEGGVFLDKTFRMHPGVSTFVSEVFYDGRLESDASSRCRSLEQRGAVGGTGLRYIPVEHLGNRTVSPEEVERIADEFGRLVGLIWTDEKGHQRPLGIDDILIVAPYNAQVRLLAERLPVGTHVGTVDKFQGQEAPVVMYSMATSTPEEVPRGLDFLYSLNRLNVAVSRAQCLVMVVASPKLFRVVCRNVHQMRLANAFARLIEVAQQLAATDVQRLSTTDA